MQDIIWEPASAYVAVLKVIGVGGAGVNAVNRMIESGLQGVEFVVLNTDAQSLMASDAMVKLEIGGELTKGLGAGANPEVGRKAADAHRDELEDILRGADMVFVTCGEGGGTGTGAAPVVAEVARNLGALTVGIVTRPFGFEGRVRSAVAEKGISELREQVDTLVVVPNDRLLEVADPSAPINETFRMADEVLMDGVAGITNLINTTGLINVDFADVKTVMADGGSAVLGVGKARGEDRALQSAKRAISSPLLEISMDGASGILLSVAGSREMTLHEAYLAAETITELASDEANIIFGAIINDALGEEMQVTVIAAGFDRIPARRPTAAPKPGRSSGMSSSSPGSGIVFDIPSASSRRK
ncbi:MAG: cell division protein FtsZ [bacterium]|nr:cell division protein FtsZ [Acidimicrobiia bacterium]MCY4650601.1 cell division protein FtsZ [bacterium]